MQPDDFVGPEFSPSNFNVIKHPEYRILSIPDTGLLFRPKLLDSMLFDLSIPDNLNPSKIKIETAYNIPFHYKKNKQSNSNDTDYIDTRYVDKIRCNALKTDHNQWIILFSIDFRCVKLCSMPSCYLT